MSGKQRLDNTEWAAVVRQWVNNYEPWWFIVPRNSCFNHRGLPDEENHEDLWLWGRVTAVLEISTQNYKSGLLLESDGDGLSNQTSSRTKLPCERATLLDPWKNQSEMKAFQWLKDPPVGFPLAKVILPFLLLVCLFCHRHKEALSSVLWHCKQQLTMEHPSIVTALNCFTSTETFLPLVCCFRWCSVSVSWFT